MKTLRQNARYSIRLLWKNPGGKFTNSFLPLVSSEGLFLLFFRGTADAGANSRD